MLVYSSPNSLWVKPKFCQGVGRHLTKFKTRVPIFIKIYIKQVGAPAIQP